MQNVFRLRLGALLHFLIAVGHLICLFFLEDAFRAYGILDEMKHLCFGRNGCCMLLRFAWQLALPLQACMRSPLLVISESYHCGDW